MSENHEGGWIQVYSGRQFWPCDPRPEDIDIIDIAHALSNICRFTGHCEGFFSVAQHSVFVSHRVSPANALWGLLHDASEAYIADIARPMKPELEGYQVIEEEIMRSVGKHFGLPWPIPAEVKLVDNRALMTERRDLLKPSANRWVEYLESLEPYKEKIVPLGPMRAKLAFLARFAELTIGGSVHFGHQQERKPRDKEAT